MTNEEKGNIFFVIISIISLFLLIITVTYITKPVELTKLDNGKCLVKQPFLYNGVTHKGDITLNYSESVSVRDCKK